MKNLIAICILLTANAFASQSYSMPIQRLTMANVMENGAKQWIPKQLDVKKGSKVELTLINTLDAPHGFAIDAYGVKVTVPANGKKVIKFNATKKGEAKIYCQLHKAHKGGVVRTK